MSAPVAVFAYNRPQHLGAVLQALSGNAGAEHSKLYIFCDGARNESHEADVRAVRQVARQSSGFGKIEIIEREKNWGLARSIVEGVRDVCAVHGRVIVLEDDIVPTPFFLPYVNAALDRYADAERVISIGCHTFDSGMDLPETFFLQVPDCWGWGVWQRSWTSFQADGADLLRQILDREAASRFDFDGTYPYTQMLKDCVAGRNQSWAVRWYAHAFLTGSLVLYPSRAVTSNIGFDGSGVHCGLHSGLDIRFAQCPIAVEEIPLEESPAARGAWKEALFALGGRPPGSVQRLTRRVKRMLLS
ncbi:MAG: glycosyltransferase [Hyphomonadaceae bacterium]|jgi:hypothetical protein|nr:glycosyltransferase [Hyphomonadaceae bacterium]